MLESIEGTFTRDQCALVHVWAIPHGAESWIKPESIRLESWILEDGWSPDNCPFPLKRLEHCRPFCVCHEQCKHWVALVPKIYIRDSLMLYCDEHHAVLFKNAKWDCYGIDPHDCHFCRPGDSRYGDIDPVLRISFQ